MREGIGEFLSSLDRAGYKIVVLTMTPITKADKVRKTLREISDHEKAKWGNGAALPHAPVFATSDHTANVFVKKLADKALGAAGVANRASFKRGVIGEISSLFEVLNSQVILF